MIPVDNKNVRVGQRVVRGVDWKWGDQDIYQGVQQTGTIESINNYESGDWVIVRWDGSNISNHYRIGGYVDLDMGKDDHKVAYDLAYAAENPCNEIPLPFEDADWEEEVWEEF